jgi:hypothetical protein
LQFHNTVLRYSLGAPQLFAKSRGVCLAVSLISCLSATDMQADDKAQVTAIPEPARFRCGISSGRCVPGKVPPHVVDELRRVGKAGLESNIAIWPNEIQAGRAGAIGRLRAMLRITQHDEVLRRSSRRLLRTNNEAGANQSSAHVSELSSELRQLRHVRSRVAPSKQQQAKVRRAEVREQ